jgi:hypothetical protein
MSFPTTCITAKPPLSIRYGSNSWSRNLREENSHYRGDMRAISRLNPKHYVDCSHPSYGCIFGSRIKNSTTKVALGFCARWVILWRWFCPNILSSIRLNKQLISPLPLTFRASVQIFNSHLCLCSCGASPHWFEYVCRSGICCRPSLLPWSTIGCISIVPHHPVLGHSPCSFQSQGHNAVSEDGSTTFVDIVFIMA